MFICNDYVSNKERLALSDLRQIIHKKSENLNMLILQRHSGESFWIDNDVQIIVLGHFNGITHIGIEAPPEIKILRDEAKNENLGNKDD